MQRICKKGEIDNMGARGQSSRIGAQRRYDTTDVDEGKRKKKQMDETQKLKKKTGKRK